MLKLLRLSKFFATFYYSYYLCVSQHGKKYFIVSHKDIVEMAENDPTIISPKSTRNYRKGYSVNFVGETRNSEDYIDGSALEEIL